MSFKDLLNISEDLLDKQKRYANVDNAYKDLTTLKNALMECRNELCLHCGRYKNEHLGACKGCKWYDK